jgi:hypothetical protein
LSVLGRGLSVALPEGAVKMAGVNEARVTGDGLHREAGADEALGESGGAPRSALRRSHSHTFVIASAPD